MALELLLQVVKQTGRARVYTLATRVKRENLARISARIEQFSWSEHVKKSLANIFGTYPHVFPYPRDDRAGRAPPTL